jgi:hypothetical protein
MSSVDPASRSSRTAQRTDRRAPLVRANQPPLSDPPPGANPSVRVPVHEHHSARTSPRRAHEQRGSRVTSLAGWHSNTRLSEGPGRSRLHQVDLPGRSDENV